VLLIGEGIEPGEGGRRSHRIRAHRQFSA
jgi:hypothetical protein